MDSFVEHGLNFGARGGSPSSPDGANSDSGNDTDHHDQNASNHNTTSHTIDTFVYEWFMFKQFWDRALHIYQPVEISVIALGLFGNVLALMTLLRSRRMSTPSFIYHRVLVGADLLFCITYFIHMLVRSTLSIPCNSTFYRDWFGAYFTGTVNPAINHICGYVIMYMTLTIALDRFLALLLFERYRYWNRMRVAYSVTLVACALAVCVHCWAYFTHGTVVEFRLSDALDESKSITYNPCWTDPPVAYHWTKRENISRIFAAALKAKDYYNGAVRVGYPVLLGVMTLGVLISFAKRQKKRRRESTLTEPSFVSLPTTADGGSQQPMSPITPGPVAILKRTTSVASRKISTMSVRSDRSGSLLSSVFSFGGTAANGGGLAQRDRLASPSVRHRQRCERALFYLMISVVLLAFLQVASSESRRILSLMFPPDEIFKRKVIPSHVPMHERVANFRFLLYGHQATRILANFCTAIDRSFICFLYIAMNNLFRRELLSMLNGLFCSLCARWCCFVCPPHRVPSVFAQRKDSAMTGTSRGGRGGGGGGFGGGPLEARSSAPLVPPPSPSPTGTSFPGTLPSATDRGYAQCRFLGESLALLENAN